MDEMDDEAPYPRFLSRGRAYAYLLPCRDEDIAKIGFTRDPLERLHTLHRRFFDFFDLERALVVETSTVKQARAIERALIEALVEHRAPAPLVVRRVAGGHTEWYRGASDRARELLLESAARDGHATHEPLRAWLRARFAEFAPSLYQLSAKMVEADDYERHNAPPEAVTGAAARALRDTLDAFEAIGLDACALVPERAWSRYREMG